MINTKYAELEKLIKDSDCVVVMTHAGADFDAITSATVMYHALTKYYDKKDVKIIIQNFEHELGGRDIGYVADKVVDHHRALDIDDPSLDLYINERRSSAVEQVYVIFRELIGEEWIKDKLVSRLTQCGMITDTNRFMYSTTSPETFEIMAQLRRTNDFSIDNFVYDVETYPRNMHKALNVLNRNMVIKDDLMYTFFEAKELEGANFTRDDVMEAISFLMNYYLRRVKGINYGFVLNESIHKYGNWKLSMRSRRGSVDVSKVARVFGGGGHPGASGARLSAETVEGAINVVLSEVDKIRSIYGWMK